MIGLAGYPHDELRNALTLQDFIATCRTWIGLLVLGTLLGAAVSFAIAFSSPPNYLGQVTLLVTPPTTATGITFSDIEVTQALAPTFAELSTTAPLLRRVIASTRLDIDVESLAGAVTTHVPVGTSLIDIAVTTRGPNTAAALANAIAAELVKYPDQGLQPQTSVLKVALTVVDPAVPPRSPQGLGILARTALGGAIGLLISSSLAFFVENLRRGAQSPGREVKTITQSPGSSGRGATGLEHEQGGLGGGDSAGRGNQTSDRQAPAVRAPAAEAVKATPAPEAVATRVLATAVYVTGSAGLQPGRRYGIGLQRSRLQILGPIDADPSAVVLDRPVRDIDASVVEGRLIVSDPRTRSGLFLAFMSVEGRTADDLAAVILEATAESLRT